MTTEEVDAAGKPRLLEESASPVCSPSAGRGRTGSPPLERARRRPAA